MYRALVNAVQARKNIKILLNHKLTRILREGFLNGRVLGVEVESAGTYKYIKARRGIVIATGGFCLNQDLIKRHAPRFAGLPSTNVPGTTTGEGLLAAVAIGAYVRGMDYIQCWPMCDYQTGSLVTMAAGTETGIGIMVNVEGKRFVEELERRDVRRDAVLAQPGGFAFAIIDSYQAKLLNPMGVPGDQVLADQLKRGVAFMGNTIEELAKNAGINPENLKKTVENWNKYVDEGYDPEFHRRDLPTRKGARELKILDPPFYAIKGRPSLHHTMGGLYINKEARVLDEWGKPTPALFAAGEVTGGIHGTNRIGGNAIVDCIVFGRIAGKNAAAEQPWY